MLRTEPQYVNGLLHGKNLILSSKGQLKHEEFFCEGFRNATQKEWYLDGNIKCIAEYIMGQLHGIRRCWHRNGQLKSEELFEGGRRTGFSRQWDTEGRLWRRLSYLGGRPHGEWIVWAESGKELLRQFYHHGIRIPPKYEALIISNKLTAKHILRIKNAEVRRVCLEALGYSRFLAQLPHEVIHRDGDQELVVAHWHKGEEPLCLVKVRCPTTGAFYVLRVPPGMKMVKQAVAWTFGVREAEYQPDEEA